MAAQYHIFNNQTSAGYGETKTDAIANARLRNPGLYGTITVIVQFFKDENNKKYALPIEAKNIEDLVNQLKPYPEMAQEAADKRIWENPPKAALQKADTPLNWMHIGAGFAAGAVVATVVTILVKRS